MVYAPLSMMNVVVGIFRAGAAGVGVGAGESGVFFAVLAADLAFEVPIFSKDVVEGE